LAAMPKDEDGAALVARIPPLAGRYQQTTQALVDAARTQRPIVALETAMTRAREDLLPGVREDTASQLDRAGRVRDQPAPAAIDTDHGALALGTLVLGLLAITALFTVQSVRRPALALLDASRRMAAGDFDLAMALGARVPRTGDELAELSRAFAAAAMELR